MMLLLASHRYIHGYTVCYNNVYLQAIDHNILQVSTTIIYTSIKIIKNEVGCRDDTVPKTVDTRKHCEEE